MESIRETCFSGISVLNLIPCLTTYNIEWVNQYKIYHMVNETER